MPDKDIPTVLFEDDPDDRATRALREGLRRQAQTAAFQPLDARTLAQARPGLRSTTGTEDDGAWRTDAATSVTSSTSVAREAATRPVGAGGLDGDRLLSEARTDPLESHRRPPDAGAPPTPTSDALPDARPATATTSPNSARARNPHKTHRARWVVVAVGAVAATVVAALVVPMIARPQPIEAVPALTPVASPSVSAVASPSVTPSSDASIPVGRWMPTAAPPLSPRSDAIAAWVDGQFLVVGGDGTVPCVNPNDPKANCEASVLRDGARYDPATDTWTRIADAPAPLWQPGALVDPAMSLAAVVNHTLYAYGGTDADSAWVLLAYDLDTDRWTKLPAPDELSISRLVSDGQTLMATRRLFLISGDDPNRHMTLNWQVFDQDRNVWSALQVKESSARAPIQGAMTLVDGRIVATVVSQSPNGLRMTMDVFDARTGTQIGDPARSTPLPIQRTPNSFTVGEFAVWPHGGFANGTDDPRAFFYSVAQDAFTNVKLPTKDGPFTDSYYDDSRLPEAVTTDTMIALRGFLYDPSVGKWSPTPALPGPSASPVLGGGGDYVLDCFGWDEAARRQATDCHILKPAPATLDKPTLG